MRALFCLAVIAVGCREQNTEPPTGHEIKPPRSAAWLAPEAGLSAPQANLMGTVVNGVMTTPPGGITQKLFADDVAADELALSISIETIGNVATVIIPRGTKLPVSHTEVFSTAQDDQDRVEVHLMQGERPLVSQNRSLGKFQLFGIPRAPRGIPQIEVTFTVSKDGELTVSARDKATNHMKEIRIYGAAAAMLDKAAIDKILAEAKAAAANDAQLTAWTTVRNDLESLIYADRKLLKDAGSKLSAKTRTRFQREIAGADAVLANATRPADLQLLLAVKQSLGKVGNEVATELYARSQ
ncbi:MAG TPA: Hsp70 family protein [Kofleriaceae bacterium]